MESGKVCILGQGIIGCFLVYRIIIDELNAFSDVMDSKMKALQWEKLTAEFYAYIGDQNMVSKAQLVRKWHNWKQYNKGASIEFILTYRRFTT